MSTYVPDDPIAALATPFGRSAIAVIRTTGSGSIDLVANLFSRPERLRRAEGNTVHYGKLLAVQNNGASDVSVGGDGAAPRSAASGEGAGPPAGSPSGPAVVDEVVATVFRAPASYTGQDSVEISCHGSPAGIEAVLELLYGSGFRAADPGEFTFRAFLNGKLDLTRAEAVNELIGSQTKQAHELALHRLSGAVEREVNAVKSRLTKIMAAVEIQLDYPEEDTGEVPVPRDGIDHAIDELNQLLRTYSTGRLYQEGARVAIAGKTNAGKSSLFNRFVREDRAIVSETHGTTRDYLETQVSIGGIPLRLFDTAGLRNATEEIESEGIRRSDMLIEHAELVLYVVDGTVGLTEEDSARLRRLGLVAGGAGRAADDSIEEAAGGREPGGAGDSADAGAEAPENRVIPIWNKCDREERREPPAEWGFIEMSAESGAGFGALEEEIRSRLLPHGTEGDTAAVIDSARQKQLLERCVESLRQVLVGLDEEMPVDAVALDLQDALQALGEITGEVTTSDILDTMFQGFCVGK